MSHDAASDGELIQGAGPERRKRRYVANRAFGAIKAQHAAHRTLLERFVDKLNDVASSVWFLVVHVVWFAIWICPLSTSGCMSFWWSAQEWLTPLAKNVNRIPVALASST